jgi:hypothetical protein
LLLVVAVKFVISFCFFFFFFFFFFCCLHLPSLLQVQLVVAREAVLIVLLVVQVHFVK